MPFWFLMLQDLSAMMVTHVAVRATLILASAGIHRYQVATP